MRESIFRESLIWGLIFSLATPYQAAALPTDTISPPSYTAPRILHIEAAHATEPKTLSLDITEARTVGELTNAVEMAREVVSRTGESGGKTVVLALSGSEANETEPLMDIARHIGEANPAGSEIISGEWDEASKTLIRQAENHHVRRRVNYLLTVAVMTGVLVGVTAIVSINKNVRFIDGLTVGLVAAAVVGPIQLFNTGVSRWLVSRGAFQIATPGESPAPHLVTIGKFSLITLGYLSGLTLAIDLSGVAPGSFLSLENAFELGVAVPLGTALEYYWERFLGESLQRTAQRNLREAWKHLVLNDSWAAGIAVMGTVTEALGLLGFYGWCAVGVVAATGAVTYYWRFERNTVETAVRWVRRAMNYTCKSFLSRIF